MTRSGSDERLGIFTAVSLLVGTSLWAAPFTGPSAAVTWREAAPVSADQAVAPSDGVIAADLAPPAVAPKPRDFEEALAGLGTWVNEPGLGPVWQPSAAVVGTEFVPYVSGGSWVWTIRGWAFHSDWSWGWAPFHYGRWYLHERHGWVWAPHDAWAPAWVEWRTSEAHVAWAPLGPAGHRLPFGLGATGWTVAAREDFTRPGIEQYARYPVKAGSAWEWKSTPPWRGAGIPAWKEPPELARAAPGGDPYAPLDWSRPQGRTEKVGTAGPNEPDPFASSTAPMALWFLAGMAAGGGPYRGGYGYGQPGAGFPGSVLGDESGLGYGDWPYSGAIPGGGPYSGRIPGGGPYPGGGLRFGDSTSHAEDPFVHNHGTYRHQH